MKSWQRQHIDGQIPAADEQPRPSRASGSAGDSIRRRLGFGLIPALLGALRGIISDETAFTSFLGIAKPRG